MGVMGAGMSGSLNSRLWACMLIGDYSVYYMLVLLLAVAVHSQSPHYDIPAYYGHFSHNYFTMSALKNAKMV